ncbi:MAG: hypothetical protein Kow00107_04480 [Planctomycetota bacterium]
MNRLTLAALLGGVAPALLLIPLGWKAAAGCAIGAVTAAVMFGLVLRQFDTSVRRGKGVRALMFLSVVGKIVIVAAALLTAAKIGKPAVAGIFVGVVGALGGVVFSALKGNTDEASH